MTMRALLNTAALAALTLFSCAEGAIAVRDGRVCKAENVATLAAQEHYDLGMLAFKKQQWRDAAAQFRILTSSFPGTALGNEAEYFYAFCLYRMAEFEPANDHADKYLASQSNPQHFDSAMRIKFCCADAFRHGRRRRLFGASQMPKWLTGKQLALDIYDEVAIAMPSHPLGARALFAKAGFLKELRQYRDALDCLQQLVRRHPNDVLTADAYVAISDIYRVQASSEHQNPDLLAFVKINRSKFQAAFPNEPRLAQIDDDVAAIYEYYAGGLYETGQFYERTNKPNASIIYYHSAISRFPDTAVAEQARERLRVLRPEAPSYDVALEELLDGAAGEVI